MKISKKFIKIILLIATIFLSPILFAQNKVNEKKLIEFGWDFPKISFLKTNINKMQNTPFDGVVFSFDFDIYNAFDTRKFGDSIFQYNDLAKISWQKLTDNFLFVRGASYTGAHWLEDKSWMIITENLKKVSKVLAISKAKGIGFDPEYGYPDSTLNPWVYKASLYNNLSYQQVGGFVRKRGKQFIQALQTSSPNVKILCFWLLGLVADQNKSHPIEKTGMALYPFFVEGMLEGKNATSEIIDGNESSYWYQLPENFIISGEYLQKIGNKLIDQSLQSKYNEVSHAQAVFFDGLYARHPRFEKGFDKETKERWLRDNLYNAYKTTDKYVWFYSERINWWKNSVDSGLAQILKEVKTEINADQNNKSGKISGNSSLFNFKKQSDNYIGFYYTYIKSQNILQINLLDKDVKSLQVYNKSKLIYELSAVSVNSTINLNKVYNKKGNLIIIAKNSQGIASVAYVN